MKGIFFGNTHSYDDLGLILSEVEIPPAVPKLNFVDIPGGDGSIDLTNATGETRYSDRECVFTFTVGPCDNFDDKQREINRIFGSRMSIILDRDPDYYWYGRCYVDEYKSDRCIHQIAVKAVVQPYRKRIVKTVRAAQPGDNIRIILPNGGCRRVTPTIAAEAECNIVFKGITYHVSRGNYKLIGLRLEQGENEIIVSSSGATTFTYREEEL